MNKKAWISLAVFAVLLALVFITRQDTVSVGVRTMSLMKIDAAKVKSIRVQGKDKSALLTQDGGKWFVAAPDKAEKRYATEEAPIRAMVKGLEELEATGFITGRKEKHADLDIDDDQGTKVTIELQGGTTEFVFGRFAKGGGNYIRFAGKDEVFASKGGFATAVNKDVNQWRKHKLLDVKEDEITGIKTAKYSLVKSGDHFTLENAPPGFRVSESAIQSIVRSAVNLRASDFSDASSIGDLTGQISVMANGESTEIRFGQSDDNKRILTQVGTDPQVYLLPEYAVNNVRKDVDGLRDLGLVVFSPAEVVKVEFANKSGTTVVEKAGDTWTMTPPSAGFDPGSVLGKLSILARLRATSIERKEKIPFKDRLEVRLTMQDGTMKTVVFGDEAPKVAGTPREEYFVQGAEDEFTYRIAKFQRDRFAKPAEFFKKPPSAPPPMPGGGMQGLDQLPPEIRRQIEAQMRQQGR